MKVLQTLGRHRGTQEGIFQYKRGSAGVTIDGAVGRADLTPNRIILTHDEWRNILAAIENSSQGSFRLSGFDLPAPPALNQALYNVISDAVPHPAGGWRWHDSWRAYVAAILEHEGSVDLYAGPLGPQHVAIISLARDIP
jgi:hypothetical protein